MTNGPASLWPFAAGGNYQRLLVVSHFGVDAGELLERLARTGYTLMLTSSIEEAIRLATEHRPAAVLSQLRSTTDHLDLARQLDADERTRNTPLIQVRHGWKLTPSAETAMRSQAATLVNPRLVIVANRGPTDFVWTDGQSRCTG